MSERDAGNTGAYADDGDDDYIKVLDGEGTDVMEFPKEDNNTVMLSTIQAQFPHAIGLKFLSSSGAWRAVRAVDNVLDAPRGGWGERSYYVTAPESYKRKRPDSFSGDKEASSSGESKYVKPPVVDSLLKDMAVLGLAYETTDAELKEYFETNCGELAYSELKVDRTTGKSRGFGFIRFKSIEAAKTAVDGDHYIQGRKVLVRQKKDNPMKLFVGRLPRGTSKDELTTYFAEFGELTDVYVPEPCKGFAFITYASTEVGRHVLRQSHFLGGSSINVEERKDRDRQQRGFSDRSNSSYDGGRSNSSYRGGSSNSPYDKRDSTRDDRSNSQHNTSDDRASELKNLLAKFLQH